MHRLSREQQGVVKLSEGKHIVFAPPGTGKTEILAHRINYALAHNVNPEEMLCLTFTNRAAKNMQTRIENYNGSHSVFVGNLHSFSYRFLIKNKLLPRYTALMDEEDSYLLLREAVDNLHYRPYGVKNFYEKLSLIKNYLKQRSLNFPENLIKIPNDCLELLNDTPIVKNICEEYERLKEESELIDFDDLLNLAYCHLSNGGHKKYKWIQVDEAQDLNPLQFRIIELLSEDSAHVVYFGDREQSIFSFMGADLETVNKLRNSCTLHTLTKNYRSPAYLLKVFVQYANSNLNPTWDKEPRSMLTGIKNENALRIYHVDGQPGDEIDFIVENLIKKANINKEDRTAILVHSNKRAEAFSEVLLQEKIPHFKISGFDLFRRRTIKDIMAFLSVLENKYDRLSWSRIFHLFAKISTLKESRLFINKFWEKGLFPDDLLDSKIFSTNYLSKFLSTIQNQRVVVFDTETTGLNKKEDDIIQIAAVELINGSIGREFCVYIKTDLPLEESSKIHNITRAILDKQGLDAAEAFKKFNEFVDGAPLIAHNLDFDYEILSNNIKRKEIEFNIPGKLFDTLNVTRRVFPKLNSYKLADLIKYFSLEGINSHNALDDVKATASLIKFLIPEIKKKINEIEEFLLSHKRTIEKLQSNFSPLWEIFYSSNDILDLPYLINLFLEYLMDNNILDMEQFEKDKPYLEKLIRHMKLNCKELPVKELLNKYVPEYKLYKEADLITGEEKIIVSTIHKAKGLEFENVIIPGCINGVFPSFYSRTKEEELENARLLYVALTRSKKNITITTYSKFLCYTKTPSRYLRTIENLFVTTKVNHKYYKI
ncbi:ATP-dependent helicase [Melioribacter sp. OK-6-Me]